MRMDVLFVFIMFVHSNTVVEENRGWLTVLSPGSNGTVYGYLLSAHATPLQELETMKSAPVCWFLFALV